MPPRSAKKGSAKKSSPGMKKQTPPVAEKAPLEALPTTEEEVKTPEAEAQLSAEEKVVLPEKEEEEPTLSAEEKVPEVHAGTALKDEDVKEEVAAEEETTPLVAFEEAMEEADVPPKKLKDSQTAPPGSAEAGQSTESLGVLADVRESNDGPSETDLEQGAKQNIAEEGCIAAEIEDTDASGTECDDVVDNGDERASDDDSDNEEDKEDVDPSIYMHAPITERKKNKEFEIFIGGLGKDAVEDDLTKVFSEFGEIQSARIVKHPVTQKSKGFAFIRYATVEQAKKVLAELKDGVEVKGRRVGVSASLDNDTLYMGNICKTWSKDHVLETITGYGVKQIDEILLPDDPKNEGKNKGFAFLEFASHSDAMAAFQRLRQPDAIFGCDRSAKVAFAQSSMHPSEEALSQVKTVYIDGLPLSWDEEKIREFCKQYGEIEKVQLSRNFTKNKRKDFGFVAFTSRESAVACVEGINNGQLGEEAKVKANLAKPQRKGRFAKQGSRGGFKVKDGENTEAGQFNIEGQEDSKETHGKRNTLKVKGTNENKSVKSQGKTVGGKVGPYGRQKMVQPRKVRKRSGKNVDGGNGMRSSKKARNDRNFGNAHFGKPGSNYTMYPNAYASGYAAPASSYATHTYAGVSGSQRQSDLEPHAGYIPTARQGQDPYGYAQRRVGHYDSQHRMGAGGFVNQRRTGAGEYDHQYSIDASGYNQQRIVMGGYDSQQRIVAGGYDTQQRIGAGGFDNQRRVGAGYAEAGPVLRNSYSGHPSYTGYEVGYGSYAPQRPYH